MGKIILLFVILLTSTASNTHSSDIVKFGTVATTNNKIFSAVNQIYSEAFSKMGLLFRSIPCAPINCPALVRDGKIEGITARSEQYVNSSNSRYLEKIDFVLFELSFVAITTNSKISVDSMDDLLGDNYTIGFQTNGPNYERKILEYVSEERLMDFVHWTYGAQALLNKSIDIYIAMEQVVVPELGEKQYEYLIVSPLKDQKFNIFPIVSTDFKHTAALKKSLEEMRKNGRIKAIFSRYGIPI